jgi:hypothetical protein
MTRKKKHTSRAKNADSVPASPFGERQSLRSQSQQPKPRRAKKTVSEQRLQGQDKTSDVRLVRLTVGFDKNSKKPKNIKTQTSQKTPQNLQRKMARRGRQTNGPSQNPGSRPQAQLELPDWIPPKNQAKNSRRKSRGNGAAKTEPAPPPKPWEMDDIFVSERPEAIVFLFLAMLTPRSRSPLAIRAPLTTTGLGIPLRTSKATPRK